MTEDLRAKLRDELLREALLEDVQPHIQRGVAFLVRGVSLLDAGLVLATDDKDTLQRWLTDRTIQKPQEHDLARWTQERTRFAALIVAPFLLLQEEAPGAQA